MLPIPPAAVGAQAEVLCGFLWGLSKVVERAGHVLRVGSDGAPISSRADDESDRDKPGAPRFADEADVTAKDLYAILGLKKLRWSASDDDIRRAYRQCILKFHPDKMNTKEEEGTASAGGGGGGAAAGGAAEESDEGFKALHKAYETLSDAKKRRLYDSSDEFDESIPNDREPKDFYAEFAPVFDSNSRWSCNKPCPQLGDDKTPIDAVHAFYNFWFDFQSWREFQGSEDFDLDDAESREERRWMERKNAKEKSLLKKRENERVRTLVETAYKWDPRIRREKEMEKEKREQIKRQKAEKIERARLDKERKIQEEKDRAEREEAERKEAQRLVKADKDRQRKLLKKERARIRAACGEVDEKLLEDVLAAASLERLTTIAVAFECDHASGLEHLRTERAAMDAELAAKLEEERKKFEALALAAAEEETRRKAEAMKGSKPWDEEELSALIKACAKFPGGTANRWEAIAKSLGSGRTADEVLKQVSIIRKSGTLGAKQVFRETAPPPKAAAIAAAAAAPTPAPPPEPEQVTPPKAKATKPKTSPAAAGGGGGGASGGGGGRGGGGAAAAAPEAEQADEEGWTVSQQRKLEAALLKYPGSMPTEERWNAVAEAVDGKTRKECVARYKSLRAKLVKK